MARVVRLNEQEFKGLLSDLIKMITGGQKTPDTPNTTSSTETDSDDVELSNISAKGQELLNNPTFKDKLKEVSSEIGVGENSIIKLMKHES